MKKFYMVLQTDTCYTKYRHDSYELAKTEAIRLARNIPSKEFLILCAIASVIKDDIKIDEVASDSGMEIPF